jgi:cell division protease FtsH
MSERVGLIQLAPRENPYLGGPAAYAGGQRPFSEETAEMVDEEVRRIVSESYAEATRLLNEHRKALDALAQTLLERETLDEQAILEVTGLGPAKPLTR